MNIFTPGAFNPYPHQKRVEELLSEIICLFLREGWEPPTYIVLPNDTYYSMPIAKECKDMGGNRLLIATEFGQIEVVPQTEEYSPIAQLVEQGTVNASVVGSNPARGAT